MDTPICRLTLICPESVADELSQLLAAEEPGIEGVTSWPADGHGERFDASSRAEQLAARYRRVVFVMAVRIAQKDRVLEAIRLALPASGLTYWVEPLMDFGKLAVDGQG